MKLLSILLGKEFQVAAMSLTFCLSMQCAHCAPSQAQKPAAARPAASAQGNPIYDNYVNQLRPKIDKGWNFPTGKNHVVLSVDVAQDGSVTNLNLTSSPKSGEAEQKASDAFNAAQPLPSLPSGSLAKLVVTFDSQADQWDSKSSISVRMDPVKGGSSSAAPAATHEAPLENKGDASESTPPPAAN